MTSVYYIYGAAFVVLTLLVFLLMYLNSRGSSTGRLDQSRINGMLSSAALAKGRFDYSQALLLYEEAIAIIDGEKETDEALLITTLQSAAECLERMGKLTEAKEQRTRLLSIFESALNNARVDFLTDIDYLCSTADFGSSTIEVATFYERLLAFREKTLPQTHSDFINTIVIYSRLMRKSEKELADDLEAHAETLRKGGSANIKVGNNEGAAQAGGNGAPGGAADLIGVAGSADSSGGSPSGSGGGPGTSGTYGAASNAGSATSASPTASGSNPPIKIDRSTLEIRTVPLLDDDNLDDLTELTEIDRRST